MATQAARVDPATVPDVQDGPAPEAFRGAMGLFPTGIAVITVGQGADTEAMTASSVTSISLDPMLVLVSVNAVGRLVPAIDGAGGFGVNVLAQDQRELSRRFATRDRPSGLAAQRLLGPAAVGHGGHLLLPDALVSLQCTTEHRYPGGDHVLYLGLVRALRVTDPDRPPLVYHRGAYTSLSA
ncbi:flavin reductase family protein [Streptomyces sp. NPDC101165]|uniref:flavin reductase family protein n=1 Tax=Streptomyces sp. NPDC101165 TaxID=3366119 RepID=UPI00382A3809